MYCTNREVGDGYMVQPDVAGSVTLTPQNHVVGTAYCTFFHISEPVRLEPQLQITPPPDFLVTPVVPVQLPTSTPTMPQLQITPPARIPDPINTPVVQLPPPTPTPELGEPPVIVITPVIPIQIVTPIVIPVVPTEPPELIYRASEPGDPAASV